MTKQSFLNKYFPKNLSVVSVTVFFSSLLFLLNGEANARLHEGETLFIDQVRVEGRAYTHSCGYYSNSEAELMIEFRPYSLPQYARVFIDFGWMGEDRSTGESFTWKEKNSAELEKNSFNRWQVSLSQITAERSSPLFLTGLHFVFRVQVPGSDPQIFGGVEEGDEYFVRLPRLENTPCVSSKTTLPDFEEWIVQIDRNN